MQLQPLPRHLLPYFSILLMHISKYASCTYEEGMHREAHAQEGLDNATSGQRRLYRISRFVTEDFFI
jgi:hypothetical protein